MENTVQERDLEAYAWEDYSFGEHWSYQTRLDSFSKRDLKALAKAVCKGFKVRGIRLNFTDKPIPVGDNTADGLYHSGLNVACFSYHCASLGSFLHELAHHLAYHDVRKRIPVPLNIGLVKDIYSVAYLNKFGAHGSEWKNSLQKLIHFSDEVLKPSISPTK